MFNTFLILISSWRKMEWCVWFIHLVMWVAEVNDDDVYWITSVSLKIRKVEKNVLKILIYIIYCFGILKRCKFRMAWGVTATCRMSSRSTVSWGQTIDPKPQKMWMTNVQSVWEKFSFSFLRSPHLVLYHTAAKWLGVSEQHESGEQCRQLYQSVSWHFLQGSCEVSWWIIVWANLTGKPSLCPSVGLWMLLGFVKVW
jgi:hypothetical protein